MKYFFQIILIIFLFSSCTIEGEEISGVWYTNGDLGPMKIEIQSSKGKFVGYLLEYQKNGKMIELPENEKELIIKDLEFKEDKYFNGKFLKNPKGIASCDLKMSFYKNDRTSMRAAHTCGTINRLEFFERDGYPEKPVIESNVRTIGLDQLLKANPNNKKN